MSLNKTIIKNKTPISKVIHLESINSTNTFAKKYAKEYANDNVLFVADQQTDGRGRKGHSFYSPVNGLYFSLLLRPSLSIEDIQLVTIISAIALRRSLKTLYHVDATIKWLNDLLINNKKVSGILTEGSLSQTEYYDFIIIVGIGINLDPIEHEDQSVQEKITSLSEHTDHCIQRESILIQFLNDFYELLQILIENHRERIIQEYKKYCLNLHQYVNINGDDKIYYVKDINQSGHLIVIDEANHQTVLNSGEVSINYEN